MGCGASSKCAVKVPSPCAPGTRDWEDDLRASRLSKSARKILDNQDFHSAILRNPTLASLPDGSKLFEQFQKVFNVIKGEGNEGVTPCKLEAALHRFAEAFPDALAMRISLVVDEVFELIDTSQTGEITWPAFEQWLSSRDLDAADHDEALSELFELCDSDGTGRVSAQEFMNILLFMSELEGKHGPAKDLTEDVAEAIVRDLDGSGEGGFGYHEFVEVIMAAKARHAKSAAVSTSSASANSGPALPHLVLNFDVNNTIIMVDTATGADAKRLLGAVLANITWGTVRKDADGRSSWVSESPEVSILAPTPGLTTYKEHIDLLHPLDASASKEQNDLARERRRRCVRAFIEPGQPGEAFRPQLERMHQALSLPSELRGGPKAVAAGLKGDSLFLLPSFLHLLRELKRAGRSFTLFFRTFGHDLEMVQEEFNALCEGRHPLFPEDDPIVLDGSDGQPDYRMRLGSPSGCGTFFRNPAEGDIALVMGTTRQPKAMEDFPGVYDGMADIALFKGHQDVVSQYMELAGQQRTIALRDYYLGWATTGNKSHGGKPFHLSWHDQVVHSIFFDDNITATDPNIVDPINVHHWPQRLCSPQLNGVHLVQVQPLRAIMQRDYFLECIERCEEARVAKLHRWDLAQRILGNLAGVQSVLNALVSGAPKAVHGQHKSYRPWCEVSQVSYASSAKTFDEEVPLNEDC